MGITLPWATILFPATAGEVTAGVCFTVAWPPGTGGIGKAQADRNSTATNTNPIDKVILLRFIFSLSSQSGRFEDHS
jgi:hypothetical protein